MKRFGIIAGIVLLSLALIVVVIFFVTTSSVETTSYFDDPYYRHTRARVDSMRATPKEPVIDSIRAGFSRVSITPALGAAEDNYQEGRFVGVPLAGYGGREGKPATGIHDSVFVKAAALRIGDKTVVFVAADLLIMPPNVVDSITVLLAKKGIHREQIFYSATHTHSSLGAWGPGYVGELFAGAENPAVEKWLVIQTAKAIELALDDLRPARIGTGNFSVPAYTRNRLIGEPGVKNNDFSFIAIEQPGYKSAIIGSYAAHATTLGEDNMEVSADYPGYWARKVEGTLADYALFFAGSVGSQSPVGEGRGFDRARHIGEALADSLQARMKNFTTREQAAFSTLSLKLQLPPYNIRLTTHRNLSTSVSRQLLSFSDNVYLQAVRINDMIWITTPSDFSGEFALQLKRALLEYGFQANVTSFNGSYVGYIVPGRYFFMDEYEPRVMGWFGPNMGEYTMDMIRQMARIMADAENI